LTPPFGFTKACSVSNQASLVPDSPPFVFASATYDRVEIFFNDQKAVAEDYPALAKEPLGGSLTSSSSVKASRRSCRPSKKAGAKIVMPLKTQFYGMREFAFQDPDGWVVTLAERVK
jgi:uncharacterized glyoxalase superfamily protein PhnB